MSDRRDPATQDRERLEQFLEWRRAQGRRRGALGRRRLLSMAGKVALGVVAVALVMWWTARALDTRPRVTSATRSAPAAGAAIPSGSRPASADPDAPAAASATSSPVPPDRASGQEGALGERAPAVERPRVTTRRPPPVELRASEAQAAPQRGPSKEPRLPALDDGAQPSDLEAAVGPPRLAARVREQPMTPTLMRSAPRGVAPDAPDEGLTAAAPSALSTPPLPPTGTVDMRPTSHFPVGETPGDRRLETLKRLVGYIPEVRAGKAIIRWMKSQPPAEQRPQQPEPQPLQAQ